MNIIIPLGGLGERFKKENYIEPKPLIKIFGKSMIFHVIDNLKINDDDNLIIIYNKELNKYNFPTILKNRYNKITYVELNKQTEGSVETILIGLKNIEPNLLENKCVLLDCDTFYHIDILSIFREQTENAVFCFNDNFDKPIYSYVKFNDNNIIYEIKEKNKISNYANSGCYCFKNGIILMNYCEYIINNNIRQNNEYYTSCVIQKMLVDNHIFMANIINYNDFICVGTPLQLKIYCSNLENNKEKKRFCFDLDNTLVTYPEIKNDYRTVKPILNNIEMLKFLKNMGHTIIIYTARRMKTHNSNIGLVIKDIATITIDTLSNFNIPYDELYFGKPYADFYIDDLGVNAYNDLEKELGFYKTNVNEREFNEIINGKMDIIQKKSTNEKIKGEIYYYKHIPEKLKKYFPIFIHFDNNSYTMEKIKGITLSYIFINETLTEELFLKFLNMIKEIHSIKPNPNNIDDINIYYNYTNKIKDRYEKYDYSKYNNSVTVYNKLIEYFTQYDEGIFSMIHGDIVFSNCILIDNNNFKLIDMRGVLGNNLTIYGDIFYDYGKILQSLIGYDEILLNRSISNNYRYKLLNIFNNFIIENYGEKYIEIIKMITNSLIFTLLPLHNNDKCNEYYKLINI